MLPELFFSEDLHGEKQFFSWWLVRLYAIMTDIVTIKYFVHIFNASK